MIIPCVTVVSITETRPIETVDDIIAAVRLEYHGTLDTPHNREFISARLDALCAQLNANTGHKVKLIAMFGRRGSDELDFAFAK